MAHQVTYREAIINSFVWVWREGGLMRASVLLIAISILALLASIVVGVI